MWQIKSLRLGTHKFALRSLLLAGTTTLLASLTLVPTVNAEVIISVNPPVCSYGYYGYAPYGCAPVGYYGPGYFYNGIFLGVGPWASWVTATAGVVIASVAVAAEDTSARVDTTADVDTPA